MPGRPPFSQLPDEVAAEILLRLPLREVARARLVCRRWHALTTDHHFVRTSSSRQAGHTVGGFFFNDHGRPAEFAHARLAGDYFLLLDHADAEAAAGRLRHVDLSFMPGTQPANPGGSNLQIYSSCHGLLLVTQGEANVYVCNPLTKKFIPISLPPRSVSPFNLAFDPSKSQHYKIVALGYMHSIHVYTSQTRSWRVAIHSDHSARLFRGLCPVRGIFWNGSIVWIVAHSLVRFVIEEEHLAMMPMPPRKENWICAYIGESAGYLQMIGYTKKDKLTACFDILEIQDDQSEWSLLYRVDLNRVKELYPDIERPTWDTRQSLEKIIDYLALSPIYVIRGIGKTGQHGVLIFSIPEKIMSYNMNDQEISMIQEIKITWMLEELEQPWFHFYAYSPSLFYLSIYCLLHGQC